MFRVIRLHVNEASCSSGEERIDRLLERPLFHLLHGPDVKVRPHLRRKLQVLRGDLQLPGCGLSVEHAEALSRDVDFVMHSAASISFQEHIHTLIAQNFQVIFCLPALFVVSAALPNPLLTVSECKVSETLLFLLLFYHTRFGEPRATLLRWPQVFCAWGDTYGLVRGSTSCRSMGIE
jgi:hypothetical protein